MLPLHEAFYLELEKLCRKVEERMCLLPRMVGLVEEDKTVLHLRTREAEKVNFGNEQSYLAHI